ncbi:MAG: tetratricopeptide repeat protein [Cyanobacterium sp.]
MSKCLNPDCLTENYPRDDTCKKCGSKLLLKNRYRAIRVIGEGGFGRTFYGIDENERANSRCVIKQFLPQAQGTSNKKKAKALFAQEARQLEKLGTHAQIPKFIDYFSQNNHQYLLQEFIDGDNLAQELASEGVFNEKKITDLLLKILPVLKFIHENQVIHRDIKPENIIRRRRDSQLFLVDFGASKVAQNADLGLTGTVIGSAQYCAPEQTFGKASYCSDLYSLGVTCLYLLTGVKPFDLFDTREGQWVWRDYLLCNPIKNDLAVVLDRLVEGASNKRYQWADEVLEALQQEFEGNNSFSSEVQSSLDLHYRRGNHFLNSGDYKRALSCFDRVMEIDPSYGFVCQKREFASVQWAKVNLEKNTSWRVNRVNFWVFSAIALSGFIFSFVTVINPNFSSSRGLVAIFSRTSETSPSQYYERGNKAYGEKNYALAITYYDLAIRGDGTYVDAYNNLGNSYYSLGKYQEAIAHYLQAITLNPQYVNGYYNLGNVYRAMGEERKAIIQYDMAIEIDPSYKNAHYNRGIANYNLGNHPEAIEDNTKVLAIENNDVSALINRGNSYFILKDYPQAMADYQQVIVLKPDYQIAYYNRGNVHRVQKNYQRAIADYQKSIDLNPNHLDSHNNMALSYEKIGNIDKAIEGYQRAIVLNPKYQLAIDNLHRLQNP